MSPFQVIRIAVCGAGLLSTASAQQHELGLTLGGILSQQRVAPLAKLDLGSGLALQANYGYRLLQRRSAALYLETHFLANGLRDIRSANSRATRDVATIFVTPGLRIKFCLTGPFLHMLQSAAATRFMSRASRPSRAYLTRRRALRIAKPSISVAAWIPNFGAL